MVHNAYQLRGGEDSVMETELALLRQRGHEVALYVRHNDELQGASRLAAAVNTFWSATTWRDAGRQIQAFRPDVMHVHNTLALVSPSIYWRADQLKVPVVQTLHNFRLLCPQAMFLRDGRVCEDCVGKLPWRGVVHGCYRESSAQTAVVAGMLAAHRWAGTWQQRVTRYIALNEFCRQKFIAGGLPADRIVVKPNFVDVDAGPATPQARDGFLFVGRLSAEKGVEVLGQAAALLPDVRLTVVGSGPLQLALDGLAQVCLRGALPPAEVMGEMSRACALVIPSICNESFPRTLVEAMGSGLPVIASRIGALAELVVEGVTGLLFEPGNAADLAAKIRWAQAHPVQMAQMGQAARSRYERLYTADINYQQLMGIYDEAMTARRSQS